MTTVSKKFKVGDKVKIVQDMWEKHHPTLARLGFRAPDMFHGYEVSMVFENEKRISLKGCSNIYNSEYFELCGVEPTTEMVFKEKAKVKSDGGSSSYYELTITNKAGESIKCETGDVIRALVGNDFDFGNCVKALRRMYLATLGMGKEGTDIPYDCNKVRYFLSEIERVNK